MKNRSRWLWAGRAIALVVIIIVALYFWHVGMAEASAIAGVAGLFVAFAALLGPYLLPLGSSSGSSLPTEPVRAGIAQSAAAARNDTGSTQEMSVASSSARRDRVPAASQVGRNGGSEPKASWVTALMAYSDMEDPDFRRLILRQMGDWLDLGTPFSVPYRPVARDHIIEIVEGCWNYSNRDTALTALVRSLAALRPNYSATDALSRLLDGQ